MVYRLTQVVLENRLLLNGCTILVIVKVLQHLRRNYLTLLKTRYIVLGLLAASRSPVVPCLY